MLQSDLTRQGQDLSFDGNLIYLDVANRRVGVNTITPNVSFSVNGNVNANYYLGLISTSSQPFITNVGTLISLVVSGNITGGNISTNAITGTGLVVSGNVTANGINANSIVSNSISSSDVVITAANLGNLRISNSTITSILTSGNINLVPTGNGLVTMSGNAVAIPSGNTARQQSGVPAGSLRYNTDLTSPEYYTGNTWIPVTTSVSYQTFTGNGVGDTYPLNQSTTTGGVLVSLNGVQQTPGVAYTVSNNTITFTEIPLNTDVVDVRFIAPGSTSGLNLIGNNTPASSSSYGIAGQVAYNSNFVYICVAANTWIRSNIVSSF